jgi:hypothetical protein
MSEEYTDEEKALIRAQLREGNRLARETALKRGVTVHPRVAEIKARAEALLDDPDINAAVHKRPTLPRS